MLFFSFDGLGGARPRPALLRWLALAGRCAGLQLLVLPCALYSVKVSTVYMSAYSN